MLYRQIDGARRSPERHLIRSNDGDRTSVGKNILVGGLLPLVVTCGLLIWQPESIRFLLAPDHDPKRLRALLLLQVNFPPNNSHVCMYEHVLVVELKFSC
jgi:hypothetical protein